MTSRIVNVDESAENHSNSEKADEFGSEMYDEFQAEALEDRMELESKCLGG